MTSNAWPWTRETLCGRGLLFHRWRVRKKSGMIVSYLTSYEKFLHYVTNPRYIRSGNCEEELPKKPVGRLSVNCRPTVDRQVTDSLPTANQQVTDRLRKNKNCGKNEQLTLT